MTDAVLQRRVGRILRAIVLTFAFLLPHASVAVASSPLTCDFSGVDSPTVSTRLSNPQSDTPVVLEFPYAYIVDLGFEDGGERGAINFRVWKRDFLPFTETDRRKPEQRARFRQGYRDAIVILTKHVPFPIMDGYARITANSNYLTMPDLAGVRQANGLYALQGEVRHRRADVFLVREAGAVTDVISCVRPEDVPSPNCRHRTQLNELTLLFTYPLDDLSQWEELRDKAAALVQCFRRHEQGR